MLLSFFKTLYSAVSYLDKGVLYKVRVRAQESEILSIKHFVDFTSQCVDSKDTWIVNEGASLIQLISDSFGYSPMRYD